MRLRQWPWSGKAEPPQGSRTIFLHSSFRVSSTWLFLRFRSHGSILTYYEIFNEWLATLTKDEARKWGPESWNSKHPTGAPYFLEFIPLLKRDGGIRNFDVSMAFECFIPEGGIDGSLSEPELNYLRGLIARAERRGKIPFLCCTRSLGRAKAIRKALPGVHMLIYRNIFQQWCSYCEQYYASNPYFVETVSTIIKSNRNDAFFRFLDDHYHVDELDGGEAFDRFILLHLYLYGNSRGAYDLVLDVNRLSRELDYRVEIEAQIADRCSLSIDLRDARESISFSHTDLGAPADFARRMEKLTDIAGREIGTQEGQAFIVHIAEDAVREYEEYCFYTRSPKSSAIPLRGEG